MNCNCKNCNAPFTCGKFGAHVKKFCSTKCRQQYHGTNFYQSSLTTTKTTTPTTDNISKNLGQSFASRAIKPALTLVGAASGLGLIGTVGAAVAGDVVTPMVKNGINNGRIKPVGTIIGGLSAYFLTKDSKVCKLPSNGLRKNCKKNYALNGAATVGGAALGSFLETVLRNWWSSLATTETTTPTTELTTDIIEPKTDSMQGINIDDLVKMIFNTYDMKGDFWGLVLGERVSNPFNVIAYGSPGGGKTTMSLKFADYFALKHGKVKYLSSEMGVSDGLKSMVQRVGMKSKKVFFDGSKKPLNELINELKEHKFKMLVIDSANFIGYSPEDIETIKDEVKGLSTFIILQSTKDGKFRGANDYAHNADVILKVADLEVFTEKTRFASKNVAGLPINS